MGVYVDGEGKAIAVVRGTRVLVLHPDANLLAHLARVVFEFWVSSLALWGLRAGCLGVGGSGLESGVWGFGLEVLWGWGLGSGV